MLRNWLWTIVVLLVVGAGVCFVLYKYTGVFNQYASVQQTTSGPALGTPENPITTAPPSNYSLPFTPNTSAVPSESIASVPVTAISPTEITVQLPSGQPRTFAIASTTLVYTTVLNNGQVGKSVGDIKVGDVLTVHWHTDTPGITNALAYVPKGNKVLGITADDSNHQFGGTVVGLSSKQIIIVPPAASKMQPLILTIPPMPNIASVVLTGQKGLNLLIGQTVVADGVATVGTTTTAKAIVILPQY